MAVLKCAFCALVVLLSLQICPVQSHTTDARTSSNNSGAGCMADMWRVAGVSQATAMDYEATLRRLSVPQLTMNYFDDSLNTYLRMHGISNAIDRQKFALCFATRIRSRSNGKLNKKTKACKKYKICSGQGGCLINRRSTGAPYTCICKYRFHGANCEQRNRCQEVTRCLHGGTCHAIGNGYRCLCPLPFTGENCGSRVPVTRRPSVIRRSPVIRRPSANRRSPVIRRPSVIRRHHVNPCSSSPCKNNGTCARRGSSFSCSCGTCYRGQRCERKVNRCAGNPCRNGGLCLSLCRKYTCSCRTGFTGGRCEARVNYCTSNPCLHAGTCEQTRLGYRCTCPPGFNGSTCEDANMPVPGISQIKLQEMVGVQSGMQGQLTRLETLMNKILANQKEQMKADGTVFYRLFLQNVTWTTAARRCRQSGGVLASVRSNQQHFMLSIVPGAKQATDGAVWLGGKRNTLRDSWRWPNGDQLGYQMWNETSQAPTNNVTGCLAFVVAQNTSPEGWAARPCGSRLPFFCEYH